MESSTKIRRVSTPRPGRSRFITFIVGLQYCSLISSSWKASIVGFHYWPFLIPILTILSFNYARFDLILVGAGGRGGVSFFLSFFLFHEIFASTIVKWPWMDRCCCLICTIQRLRSPVLFQSIDQISETDSSFPCAGRCFVIGWRQLENVKQVPGYYGGYRPSVLSRHLQYFQAGGVMKRGNTSPPPSHKCWTSQRKTLRKKY